MNTQQMTLDKKIAWARKKIKMENAQAKKVVADGEAFVEGREQPCDCKSFREESVEH